MPINAREPVCAGCSLPFIECACVFCGAPLASADAPCEKCGGAPGLYERNISPFVYDSTARETIHRFKYGKRTGTGRTLGGVMADFLLQHHGGVISGMDYIVPVPVHKKRLRMRGFNQSRILAGVISEKTGISLLDDIVKRHRETEPQSLVPMGRRWANVKGSFALHNEDRIKNKNILLVDDIFTSGSTLSAISQLLKEADVCSIVCATLSVTPH